MCNLFSAGISRALVNAAEASTEDNAKDAIVCAMAAMMEAMLTVDRAFICAGALPVLVERLSAPKGRGRTAATRTLYRMATQKEGERPTAPGTSYIDRTRLVQQVRDTPGIMDVLEGRTDPQDVLLYGVLSDLDSQ